MEIKSCIGCYTCWLKTPGICIHKDKMPSMLEEVVNSNAILFSSPVLMGFISALLKRFQERMLPLSHPFLMIVDNRLQHIPRYKLAPSMLLLEKGKDFDEKISVQIIEKVFKSSKTRNFLFTEFMNKSPLEVADEINSI
jgi:multimeric flavodoxin WrbA